MYNSEKFADLAMQHVCGLLHIQDTTKDTTTQMRLIALVKTLLRPLAIGTDGLWILN